MLINFVSISSGSAAGPIVHLNTGMLGSRKTVNIQGVVVNLPALAAKDIEDITNGAKAGFDYIFASFVRRCFPTSLHLLIKCF